MRRDTDGSPCVNGRRGVGIDWREGKTHRQFPPAAEKEEQNHTAYGDGVSSAHMIINIRRTPPFASALSCLTLAR